MRHLIHLVAVLLLVQATSCGEGPGIVAEVPPMIDLESISNPFQELTTVHAAPGKTLRVEALLTDEVGLKSFNLAYPDWFLDNTVDLTFYYPDSVLKSYHMTFYFQVPGDASETAEFPLNLTATNLGDLTSEVLLTVKMDGDYIAPTIFDVSPSNNEIIASSDFNIAFSVSENVLLDYVIFDFPAGSVYDSVSTFRGGKAYVYEEEFSGFENGNYSFSIKAVDRYENVRIKNVNFLINQ